MRLAFYMLKNRLKGRRRFPMVTMLEPLEMCNLACVGCGRIHEYKPVMDKMMRWSKPWPRWRLPGPL